tara:strand:- start:583 stop:891 length:309 start_codon:yes stop_codon:yes gene_type:complete
MKMFRFDWTDYNIKEYDPSIKNPKVGKEIHSLNSFRHKYLSKNSEEKYYTYGDYCDGTEVYGLDYDYYGDTLNKPIIEILQIMKINDEFSFDTHNMSVKRIE